MDTTTCPKCGTQQDVPSHYLDQQIKCCRCGGDYVAKLQILAPHALAQTAPASSKGNSSSVLTGIGGLIIMAFAALYFLGGGLDKIEDQVAEDAVRQYDIAKRNGNAIDASVAASFVAAAYLQAEDEANYKKWKAIEARESKRAGLTE